MEIEEWQCDGNIQRGGYRIQEGGELDYKDIRDKCNICVLRDSGVGEGTPEQRHYKGIY